MSKPAEPLHVTAGVLWRSGRVLACRRRPEMDHGGKWEFPGGKVEAGESLPDSLRRELHEELAIEATVGPALWHTEHRYPGGKEVRLHFFFVSQYRGEIRNRVFADLQWVPVKNLAEVDFLEGDREFVAALSSGEVRCEDTRVRPLAPGTE